MRIPRTPRCRSAFRYHRRSFFHPTNPVLAPEDRRFYDHDVDIPHTHASRLRAMQNANARIGGGPAVLPPSPRLTYQPACKPGSVWPAAETANVTAIPLARRLPGASSNLPERLARTDPRLKVSTSLLFGFAPGGVCRAAVIADKRGALLPHRFTLTATSTLRSRGGLFSVALSLKLLRRAAPPDVIRHRLSMEPGLSSPAAFRLWPERPSGRLTE